MGAQKLTIHVGGADYPAYMTMGALRRYKRATGNEAAGVDTTDLDSALTFLYCLTAAACHAEGVAFDMDEDTFADSLLPGDMQAFFEHFADAGKMMGDAEKKKAKSPRR